MKFEVPGGLIKSAYIYQLRKSFTHLRNMDKHPEQSPPPEQVMPLVGDCPSAPKRPKRRRDETIQKRGMPPQPRNLRNKFLNFKP